MFCSPIISQMQRRMFEAGYFARMTPAAERAVTARVTERNTEVAGVKAELSRRRKSAATQARIDQLRRELLGGNR